MKPPPTTGPIVPGWIREQIARHEGDWPRAVLACGTAAAILVTLFSFAPQPLSLIAEAAAKGLFR